NGPAATGGGGDGLPPRRLPEDSAASDRFGAMGHAHRLPGTDWERCPCNPALSDACARGRVRARSSFMPDVLADYLPRGGITRGAKEKDQAASASRIVVGEYVGRKCSRRAGGQASRASDGIVAAVRPAEREQLLRGADRRSAHVAQVRDASAVQGFLARRRPAAKEAEDVRGRSRAMVHADDCGADAGGNTGIPQLRERKNRLPGYAAGACQLAAQAVETEPVPQFNDPGILRSTKPGGQDHLSRLRF